MSRIITRFFTWNVDERGGVLEKAKSLGAKALVPPEKFPRGHLPDAGSRGEHSGAMEVEEIALSSYLGPRRKHRGSCHEDNAKLWTATVSVALCASVPLWGRWQEKNAKKPAIAPAAKPGAAEMERLKFIWVSGTTRRRIRIGVLSERG